MYILIKLFIVLSMLTLVASNANSNGLLNPKSNDELTKLLKEFLKFLRTPGNKENITLNPEPKPDKLNDDGTKAKPFPIRRTNFSIKTSKAAKQCGRPHHTMTFDKRIIGGHTANPHSWPWQIRFLRRTLRETEFNDICGGTIITDQHILTAAHCVWNVVTNTKDESSKFLIIAGDHDRSSDADGSTQEIYVQDVFIHPNYINSPSTNDIAVLLLKTALNFNENVSNCCLPHGIPTNETVCYATGWGETEKGLSDLLKQVRLPLLSTAECIRKFYGKLIGEKMLCAGYPEGSMDTCQGDSGGPLVCQRYNSWFVEGVTSWGVGCALPNNPGVYTKVASYTPWIESICRTYRI